MSTAISPAADSGSSSSFLSGKLQYIHIACEVLVIGIVFVVLNRKVSSLQSDLVECAVRIASQSKKIAELETKMEDMAVLVDTLSRRAAAPMMMPTRPVMASGSSFQPFPVFPVARGPSVQAVPEPAPVAAPVGADAIPVQDTNPTPDSDGPGPEDLDLQLSAELKELGAN